MMNDSTLNRLTTVPAYEHLIDGANPLPPSNVSTSHGRGRGGRGTFRGRGSGHSGRGGDRGGRGQRTPHERGAPPQYRSFAHPAHGLHRQQVGPVAGSLDRFQCCPSRCRIYIGRLTEAACARIVLTPSQQKKRNRSSETSNVDEQQKDKKQAQALLMPPERGGTVAEDDDGKTGTVPSTALGFPAWPDTTLGEVAARVVRVHLKALIADHASRKEVLRARNHALPPTGVQDAAGADADGAACAPHQPDDAEDAANASGTTTTTSCGLGASEAPPVYLGRTPKSITVALGAGCITSNGTIGVRTLGYVPFVGVLAAATTTPSTTVASDGVSASETDPLPSNAVAVGEAASLVLRRDDDACRLTLSAVNVELGMPLFATLHQLHW